MRRDQQDAWMIGVSLLTVLFVLSAVRLAAAIPPRDGPPDQIPVKNWRYTVTSPSSGWCNVEFDDAGWSQGEPCFGNQELPALQQSLVRTPWTTPDIWARA